MFRKVLLTAVAAVTAAACSEPVTSPDEGTNDGAPAFSLGESRPGAVYTMSNAVAGNQIIVFARSADGTLSDQKEFATGGTGTGGGLGSQGALILSKGGQWLFAVNAGSDELSVFRVNASGLQLTDRIGSNGDLPISVTNHGSLVYVLNAGGAGNIAGFRVSTGGKLSPIQGSVQPLSSGASDPAQVSFTPDGSQLVVTEKATNRILTYEVNESGAAAAPVVHAASGITPFGFAFAGRNTLIVSEAFGGAANASATSSYHVAGANFNVVSASVPTTETSACWVIVTNNSRIAFVSNTAGGSVTAYGVGSDGRLNRIAQDGVSALSPSPADPALSIDSRFLYIRNGNSEITAYRVGTEGSLTAIAGVSGLPAGIAGLAAK
ncbi:MAG TPA: beta-propeller fold lactonase family protein [Longimicrobiales bacterium]|nr:beta-propeller fold lactonase family protein [Longimicrobiales bacterium]